jgi:predicted O-methyltransferase YrrM
MMRRIFSRSTVRPPDIEGDDLIPMRSEVRRLALAAKGFLSEEEGERLFAMAQRCSRLAPCVEIGSYCGKSTLFLGEGCRYGRYNLFSVDHHRGSAEQQAGEPYFDPELYDEQTQRHNSLPEYLKNLERAGLLNCVIPVFGDSVRVAKNCAGLRASLVFIDGGHSERDVQGDFDHWSRLVIPGGYVCFHDIYLNPEDGGQAPRRVWERAQASGAWTSLGIRGSLGVLRRCR